MACNQNGKTYYNSLTPYPGGTDASTTYLMDCTHYTCGNRQMCVNSANGFPLASNFDIQVLGTPRPVGDSGEYCCDIRCICDLTYQQVYRCGNGCPNSCLQTEKVIIDIIYTEAEDVIYRALMQKWQQHNNMQQQLRDIVKKYGLSERLAAIQMARSIGVERLEYKGENYIAVNNDCVEETAKMAG